MIDPKKAAIAIVIASSMAMTAEGYRQTWYADPVGITTVCYGHTGPDIDKKKVYTKDECMALLSKDMAASVRRVDRCVPGLPIGVLAAFSDADFNVGGTIACDTTRSTAARYLRDGRLRDACLQLPRWSKANVMGVMVDLPGLVKRRNREMEICLKDLP